MDYLTKKLRDFFPGRRVSTEKREITKVESYVQLCYKVLTWEDVSLTLTVFLVLNFVFWLVVHLQIRLFGVISLLLFAAFVFDLYFDGKQLPETRTSSQDSFDELRSDLTDLVLSLKALRKDSPSTFCVAALFVFLAISFVARNISGCVICYLVLLAVFFIPLGLSKVPPQHLESLKQAVKSIASERGVLAEEELIPFISDKDFNERDPDQDSLLTDKTADSITNSLISGLNSMPSYLDAEDKESLEEEDLLPHGSIFSGISYTPGDLSSDSDSEHKAIRFESSHFNGDSSSGDEIYAQNLNFSNAEARDSVDRDVASTGIGENLIKMATMIKMAVTTRSPQRKESSSDSEFEIINTEEAEEH